MYSSSMEEQGDVLCFERRRFSMCRIGARLHLFLFLLSLATFSRQAASAADGTAVVQSPEPASKNSRADPRISVPLIAVSGLFVAVLFAVAVLQLLRRRLRRRRSRSVVVASEYCGDTDAVKDAEAVGNALVAAAVVREFNWEDIKKMTSYFGEIIGSGGFSTVYMGRLAEETGAWSGLSAVKVHSSSERLNIAFKQELDILLRIRHQNIVKLIGFCDKEGEGGALVLEYVMNGNLQEKLHGRHGNGRAVDTCPSVLSWRNRTAIAFQLARAIEYLHEKCSPQIVHGDIKPSNVLLDDSLNCKLCDFGSAKMGFSSLVMPPTSSSSTSPRTKQIMMGSPGYTDPHYLMTGIASKKNDIYSFGVLLLELITGMEAFCSKRGHVLTSIVSPLTSDGTDHCHGEFISPDIVDSRLNGEFDLKEAKAMASVARACIQQSPSLRPSASQILEAMRGHRQLLPSVA